MSKVMTLAEYNAMTNKQKREYVGEGVCIDCRKATDHKLHLRCWKCHFDRKVG